MSVSRPVRTGIIIAVVVAAAAFLIGPRPEGRAPTSPATVPASGATTTEVIDPVHDRAFTVASWPASGADQNILVVISHGFAGDGTSHGSLATDLASAGFTVAAPTHPDLAGLESEDHRLDPLVLRPRHVTLTIDHMTRSAERPYDRVAVVGHSLGGYTALRLAGARPSAEGLDRHCRDRPTDDALCATAARARIDRLAADRNDPTDPRVDDIVLLAPANGPLFSADGLAPVTAGTLIVAAEDDDQVPDRQLATLIDALPGATELRSVDGGHHVFLRPCTPDEQSAVPELCTDPSGVDRSAVHDRVAATIERFLST